MKKRIALALFTVIVILTSCVQKVYKKTVVFELDTKGVKNIYTVGIRGNDRPLNWNSTTVMPAITKDTTYRVAITFNTGYKFTEAKFVINDAFELENESNRRVIFSAGDTTIYKAIFNKR